MTIPGAPISNPPQVYLDIILPLVEKARGFLEAGESLQPIAFVGNLRTKQILEVGMKSGSDMDKDSSARAIQTAAMAVEADFIFTVIEAWSLRQDKVAKYTEIVDRYGSIGASPFAISVATFTLETRHGVWIAHLEIKPKGISKKKKTFGPVQFQYFSEFEGRFLRLLPNKDDNEGPATLH